MPKFTSASIRSSLSGLANWARWFASSSGLGGDLFPPENDFPLSGIASHPETCHGGTYTIFLDTLTGNGILTLNGTSVSGSNGLARVSAKTQCKEVIQW